jgi:hypothetical protein
MPLSVTVPPEFSIADPVSNVTVPDDGENVDPAPNPADAVMVKFVFAVSVAPAGTRSRSISKTSPEFAMELPLFIVSVPPENTKSPVALVFEIIPFTERSPIIFRDAE